MESPITAADPSSSDGVDALGQTLDDQLRLKSPSSRGRDTIITSADGDHHDADAATSAEQHSGTNPPPPPLRLICDLGYGLPKETRPRNEKIRAIARQLVNFLYWRHNTTSSRQEQQQQQRPPDAHIWIVLGSSSTKVKATASADANITTTSSSNSSSIQQVLLERMEEVWYQLLADETSSCGDIAPTKETPFPDTMVSFTESSLEEFLGLQDEDLDPQHTNKSIENSDMNEQPATDEETSKTRSVSSTCYYLSPDAAVALDPAAPPPQTVVIGLLIDRRRIQFHRSADRAQSLSIPSARWPLDCVDRRLHGNEPLNVDTVLEGMQQWHWNYYYNDYDSNVFSDDDNNADASSRTRRNDAFRQAATQAILHHQERHPERPWHLVTENEIS